MRYGFLAGISKMAATIALIFLLFGAQTGMARAEQITIVAFGDSLTQGYGLRKEDGFVPQLADWLGTQGAAGAGVRLINAGVSGETTAGGAARIGWTLGDDVDGMILELGGNDLLRGIAPKVSRGHLESILKAAQSRDIPVLLVGLVAGRNYGPDYKADFDRMYPELASKYGALYVRDFFIGLLEADGSVDRNAVLARMQSDGIHPNAEGVRDIVKGLGPDVLKLIDVVRSRG